MVLMAISVPFETLQPGMVLAEPVFNRLGQILMSKGSALSPRHLTVLKNWGIPAAVIECDEAEDNDPILDQAIQERARQNKNAPVLASPKSAGERNYSFGCGAGCSTFLRRKFLRTRQGGSNS